MSPGQSPNDDWVVKLICTRQRPFATADAARATIHALDQRLADAGPVLGVPTRLLV
jgi:hypothetical protein